MAGENKRFVHKSVLLEEAIEALAIRPDGIYVDGTMGGAGHSAEIAKRLTQGGRLFCFDRDADAIEAGTKRLAEFADRVTIIKDNFGAMPDVLRRSGVAGADGILLDLGVSSHQLDEKERGFSYMQREAKLDMRMDVSQERSAWDVVNTYPGEALIRILRDYGEERFAKRITENILQRRNEKPIETTGELVDIIDRSIPQKAKKKGHPAKRTFQAIRIEVNGELSVLRERLEAMVGLLNPGGRMAVITFHSLEDRIVKQIFRKCEDPCTCPKDFPVCVCGKQSMGKVITRRPILPGEEEIAENPRAKSAKLRVFGAASKKAVP